MAILRQICALALMLAFSGGLFLPAWAAVESAESCCRRAGKHACCKRYGKTKAGSQSFQALSGCQKKCCQQSQLPPGSAISALLPQHEAEPARAFEHLLIAGTGRVVPTSLPNTSFQRPPPSLS